ncbi:MAG TPA: TolC family protein [Verrucomicrobiae bacterium]|nr:TolC family protein [Verrucomicrobiae bacterium]
MSRIYQKLALALALLAAPLVRAATSTNDTASLLGRPLTLAECLDIALRQNSAIRKGQDDLEAAHGVVIQTRAIAIPKVRAASQYGIEEKSAVDRVPVPFFNYDGDQQWSASIRVTQSIYEGGRIRSSLRSARLTREQAIASYQTVVADALLDVRISYYDILLAEQQILVQEASVKLLQNELEDNKRRFDAGTVPHFNVLRAEVELANAKPKLIRARNSLRVNKSTLATLLAIHLPKEVWQDIPLQLAGKLEAAPYEIELPVAIGKALEQRPELSVLRHTVDLRAEAVVNARGGYKPSVQLFGGYGSRSSAFDDNLSHDVSGWMAGGQLSWDIFDGNLTRGKIQEARALRSKAEEDLADNSRKIELEVRTAHSNFIEAREVLESQQKVVEEAEESLRLATARADAGTGTQLDVLNAQTSLTEARTTNVQALHDYQVTQARLERAIGLNILQADKLPK